MNGLALTLRLYGFGECHGLVPWIVTLVAKKGGTRSLPRFRFLSRQRRERKRKWGGELEAGQL
jgi:hypothetical protein